MTTTTKPKTKRKAKPAADEVRYAGNRFLRDWTRAYDEAVRELNKRGQG